MSINDDEEIPKTDEMDEEKIFELEHLRKLFIGGLTSSTTEDILKEYYGKWGNVVDVVVMRDNITKRSRGFGFVTYTKSSMVDKAQENRPHVVDGKIVEAKRALPRPEKEYREPKISVKKLFVGGLKDNHDEHSLKEHFMKFGKVVSINVLTDKTTGKRRGFAFIEYDDYDSVDKAILHKTHSIKFSIVDVKKSIYLNPKNTYLNTKRDNNHNKANQFNPSENLTNQPKYQYSAPIIGPTYRYPPPMLSHPPPLQYTYWYQAPQIPPPLPPMGPFEGYQQNHLPQAQHTQNWNYPHFQSSWNPGHHWYNNNLWNNYQIPYGPSIRSMPPTQITNWNQPPPAHALKKTSSSMQNITNLGTGYQQNSTYGPIKNIMHINRKSPYNSSSNSVNFQTTNNGVQEFVNLASETQGESTAS